MAKEKQPLMDLEQGTNLTGFTNNEPPNMILVPTKYEAESGYVGRLSEGVYTDFHHSAKLIENPTMENVTGSGNMGPRWSEGVRDPSAPNHNKPEKAKVTSTKTKPVSCYEPEIPGLWPSSLNKEFCCIYRVPNRLRRVNPEAYTPQMLLIGPFQHSKKAEARELSKTNLRYLDYLNMERHKKKYLKEIENTYGTNTIIEFRRIITKDENIIRACYAESTEWIKSKEFVEMILEDSVFMLGFFLQTRIQTFGDILFDEPCYVNTILEDLILLENQLPCALLENLFQPFICHFRIEETFRDIVLRAFSFEGKLEKQVQFRHFTDLCRRVRVATLGLSEDQLNSPEQPKIIKSLYNADELDSAGVDFKNINVGEEIDLSLVINFEGGVLTMPCFTAEDNTDRVMRNLMALEQCHYSFSAYVCNYIAFLDFLIDTEADVDLLVKKGVVKNWLGHKGSVADMVNKLCSGLVDFGSYYEPVAEKLKIHYKSPINKSVATLRRVYFKDPWTGTATVAAAILLVLGLIQSVASVLQVTQGHSKSPPPPAPPQGL